MKQTVVAFACGLVFGIGLSLSGMTDPRNVIAFLDVTGKWDPKLAFVMIGALAVHSVAARVARARSAPFLAPSFQVPARRDIDPKLLVGSALFGVGWALTGMCPGPALTLLASGAKGVLLFVTMMAVGSLVGKAIEASPTRKAALQADDA